MSLVNFLLALVVAVVAWGALAFGAVYPWAYTPLALAAAVVGLAGMMAARNGPSIRPLAVGFVAICAAISLQFVPLSRPTLESISPGTDEFLRRFDFTYTHPAGPDGEPLADQVESMLPPRPLSIAPAKTRLGLALFAALAIFLLGTTRLVSAIGARALARAIMGLGILLTVLAAIQLALNPAPREFTLIYGFWRPRYVADPFGPFVNPNHYAGWMLMALPLVFGLAYGAFEQVTLTTPADARSRLLGVGSKDGGTAILGAFACLAMGVGLLMTKSRSGIASLALATVMAGAVVYRRQRQAHAKALVAATFSIFLLGTIAWAGVDNLVFKFRSPDHGLAGTAGRLSVWKDTLSVIRASPFTGTGFNTFGTSMLVYQTSPHTTLFQEAHNDYLQLAAEGGLLVGIPILCTLGVLIVLVRRRFREAPHEGTTYWLRVGAVVGLAAIALQSLVEFSLQMPGNAALFAVLAAIALHRSPRLRAIKRTPN